MLQSTFGRLLKKSLFAGFENSQNRWFIISLRGEGHINCRKNVSLALASIVQSLAAAKIANGLHLLFWSPAIFEFFNTIGT